MPLIPTQHLISREFFSGASMNTMIGQVEEAFLQAIATLPPVRIVSLNVYSRSTSHAGVALLAVVEEV